jgi:hypothetical protein
MIASSSVLDREWVPSILFSNSLSTTEPPNTRLFFLTAQKLLQSERVLERFASIDLCVGLRNGEDCNDACRRAEVERGECESETE